MCEREREREPTWGNPHYNEERKHCRSRKRERLSIFGFGAKYLTRFCGFQWLPLLGREKGRQFLDLWQNTQRGFLGFNGFLFFDSYGILWGCFLYCDLWVWLMWRGEAMVELLPLFHFYSWECGQEEWKRSVGKRRVRRFLRQEYCCCSEPIRLVGSTILS